MLNFIQTLPRYAFSLSTALIVIVFGSYVIVAQTTTGTWKANLDGEKDNKIHISFSRQTENNKKNSFGSSYDFSDLQGLSSQDALSSNSKVNFRLTREAGTIECEGAFNNGKGAGTFRFTADQNFVSSMQNLGLKIDDDKLFAATTLDVTTSFAKDVFSMGFKDIDFDDVFKAKIFKITPQYAAEMKSIGFENLDMEELVKARIFKIDADYAREVRAMGFSDQSMEGLVKMRIFKVTPEFLSELRGEGLVNLSVEDVVKLRIFKVDADFIRKARSENVPINVESLVNKRIGVWGKK